MPAAAAQAFVTVIGYFGSAAATYAVVYAVVTVAINYGLTRIAQSLAGKPKNTSAGPSRDVTVRGTTEPMQMIYGEVVTPGFIANFATSGTNNRFLHFMIALAAHQCEDVSDVYLDGQMAPDADIDGSGDVSTAAFQGEGASRLRILRFLGTKNQTADTTLTGAAIGDWTSNHRGAGVTWMHVRMDGSDEAFPTGAPSNFRARVKGRRVYDPRKDSTNGGSGSHRYTDATTWEWSNCEPLCRSDYITGGSRWYDDATPEPRLGFGEDPARINFAFVIAAANIADENVLIPPASPTTTQKRYTCDVQLSCGDTYKENLRVLESASVGTTTYVNGQYRIYVGAYDTPGDVAITEDDIHGPITVVTHPNGEELYNMVGGAFYDEARDWSLSPFPTQRNSSYEADDRGQKPRTIELHATRTSFRAQRIAKLHLALSRDKTTIRFERLPPKAMGIAEHETFPLTIPEHGFDETIFRCTEWEFLPDGFIAMTARITQADRYDDPPVVEYATGATGVVDTPSLDEPDTPINFEARSMPHGILFRWDVQAPFNKDTLFRLYEHTAQTPFSSATEIWSGKSRSVTIERPGFDIKYYWLTAALNGIESSPTPVTNGEPASPSLQGFEQEFYDSFEHQDYARFYNLRFGTPTISYPANGENGGRVLRCQNWGWIAWRKNIPYDPNALYMMTVRAKLVTAPTDPLEDLFYAGVEGVAADGTTLVNSTGANTASTQHYFAANGFDFGGVTLGQWTTFRGYLSGHDPTPSPFPAPAITNPAEMYGSGGTVAKFIRPLLIMNHNGGDGIMEVDDMKIERVVFTDRIGPNAATDPVGQTSSVTTTVVPTPSSGADPILFNLLTIVFTPAADGELKISGDSSVEVTGHGGALGKCWVQLVLDGDGTTPQGALSGVVYDKVISSSITPLNMPITHSISAKIDVTGGVSHTAKLRIFSDTSGTDPGQALSVNNKILRVEVNKR